MSTTTHTASPAEVVASLFAAFGRGDLEAFAAGLHPEATWNHRNPDRLGGVHRGRDAVVAFLAESGRLTEGTLRAEPTAVLTGEAGRVAVLVTISGTRPDGRTFEDHQVLVCVVEGKRVRTFDQYIGDPPAVTAFWD